VLKELHRVLKKTGYLSVSDHHLKERDLIARITDAGLFAASNKGKSTYGFTKKA
jgi:ubiquinone/menaquinone biosynthesis C-methylase UbiE